MLVTCVDIDEPGFVELVEQYAGPDVELRYVESSQPDFVDVLADADCLLVGGGARVTAETLARADRLQLIQVPQAGYNEIDLAAAKDRGVAVCNAPGVNAAAVAEHALMLILAGMRVLREHDQDIRMGRWPMMDFFDRDLADFVGSTLGIVGFGQIGRNLAAFARPLAGEILYYQRQPVELHVEAGLGARYASLEELLRVSDAVSLHVPLTDATRGMIGSRELGWMKPTAVLVNTARAAVIDESAFVTVMAHGKLRAAGLDVLWEEPPSANSPLFALPNVLLTPHTAGGSRDVVARAFKLAFDNVRRLSSGEELINRVDSSGR